MRFASVLLLAVAVILGSLAGCMFQVWNLHVNAFYVNPSDSTTYAVPGGTMLHIDCPDNGSGDYEFLFSGIHQGSRFTFIAFGDGFTGDCAFQDIDINGDVYECDPVQFPDCEFFMDLVEGEYEVILDDVTFTIR